MNQGRQPQSVAQSKTEFNSFHPRTPEQLRQLCQCEIKKLRDLRKPQRCLAAQKLKSMAGRMNGTAIVQIHEEKESVRAYIDVGADVSLIDKDYAKRFSSKIVPCAQELKLMNQDSMLIEEAVKLSVGTVTDSAVTELLLTHLDGFQLLLGKDWLYSIDAKLDIRQGQVRLPHGVLECDFSPPGRDEGIAMLVAGVRIAARTHLVIPEKIDVGKEFAGCTVIISAMNDSKGIVIPRYLATVDNEGLVPLLLSNPTSRRNRLQINSIEFHYSVCGNSEQRTMLRSDAVYHLQHPVVNGIISESKNADLVSNVSAANKEIMPEKSIEKRLLQIESLDLSHLESLQAQAVREVLKKRITVISDGDTTGHTDVVVHTIETGDSFPIAVPQYRCSPAEDAYKEKEVKKMLDTGVIQPSESPWAAPVVLVKKHDGTLRFCIDYRKLNAITKKIAYPMPRVDTLLESLAGCKWFTGLDEKSGFWQITLDDNSRPKSAFRTRSGLYEFKVMPFGLVNAPASFQHLMDVVVMGLAANFALVYVDDIIIFSRDTFEDHLEKVDCVLAALEKAKLQLSLPKCQFAMAKIAYLGHIVSAQGVEVDARKVEAIQKMKAPTSLTGLRSFLGAVGYYRRFISRFSATAAPLNWLLKSTSVWSWNTAQEDAFQKLKAALLKAPVLIYPDWSNPFIVETDAAQLGALAATIGQVVRGKFRPVAFWSRTLSDTERKYGATECEAMAAVEAVQVFSPYVWGKSFTLVTDARALVWLKKTQHKNSRLIRWSLALQEFDYTVEHRPGAENHMCDAISRLPIQELEAKAANIRKEVLFTPVPERYVMCVTKPDEKSVKINWRSEQMLDPVAVRFIQFLESGDCVGTEEEVTKTKKLVERYVMQNGILYYVGMASNYSRLHKRKTVAQPCLFVPNVHSRRDDLLKEVHQPAHEAGWKMFHNLRQKYFWPTLFDDTATYARSCDACQRQRTVRKPDIKGAIEAHYPGEYVAIDLFGKTVEPTARGNSFGLIMVDCFTKKCVCVPLPDKKSETILNAIREHWISQGDTPENIISDRDNSLIGREMMDNLHHLEIDKVTVTAYHQQANGEAEAYVKKVKSALKKLAMAQRKNWDTNLYAVVQALNASVNRSTGFSPFMLEHGRNPRLPSDMTRLPNPEPVSPEVHVARTVRNRIQAQHIADEMMAEMREEQKKSKISKARLPEFAVGTQVLLRIYDPRGFWPDKWVGPYPIVSIPSELTRELDMPGSRRHNTVYVGRLQEYKRHDQAVQPPSGVMTTEHDPSDFQRLSDSLMKPTVAVNSYEIEKILEERQDEHGTWFYRVKWAGYRKSAATWEPESALDHCEAVLSEWLTKHPHEVLDTSVTDGDTRAVRAADETATVLEQTLRPEPQQDDLVVSTSLPDASIESTDTSQAPQRKSKRGLIPKHDYSPPSSPRRKKARFDVYRAIVKPVVHKGSPL